VIVIVPICYCRDLAEQGGHTRCVEFLTNPEEMYNKRKHSAPLVVSIAVVYKHHKIVCNSSQDVDAKMAARIKQIDTEKKKKGWNLFKKKVANIQIRNCGDSCPCFRNQYQND